MIGDKAAKPEQERRDATSAKSGIYDHWGHSSAIWTNFHLKWVFGEKNNVLPCSHFIVKANS